MGHYRLLFYALKNKRVWAFLRAEYPCGFFLPGLLFGQMIGQIYPYIFVTAICTALCFKRIRTNCIWLLALISTLTGILSMHAKLLQHSDLILSSDTPYLVEVLEHGRRRKTSQLELVLKVYASIKLSDKTQKINKLERPVKVKCKGAELPWKNLSTIDKGTLFIMRSSFRHLTPSLNPFSYSSRMRRRGFNATCHIRYATTPLEQHHSVLDRLRQSIILHSNKLCGTNEKTGLFLSMSIGVRDTLTSLTETAFKKTGLAHLLVVSGYQVTLIYYFIYLILFRSASYLPRLYTLIHVPLTCSLIAMTTALLFVALSGIDGASSRAALAIVFMVIANTLERGKGMLNCICVSMLVLTLIWPACFLDPGVQLTYAALTGICMGIQFKGTWLKQYMATCAYASLFTSTVVAFWFNMFSIAGFFLNPLIAPAASIASCKIGFVAISTALLGIDPNGILLKSLVWTLGQMRDGVIYLAQFEWTAIEMDGTNMYMLVALLACISLHLISKQILYYILKQSLVPKPPFLSI